MFRRALVLTAAFSFLLLTGPAGAQLTVQILKGTAESVPIAIVPLAWEGTGPVPHDVAATVQADLDRSGRFRPLPRDQQVDQPHAAAEVDTADWRMLKVDYVLVGKLAQLADGRLEVRYELVSVANGERLLGTALPADPKALKRASHRVADAVYEKILGVRGTFATRIAYVAVDGPVNKRSYRLIVSDSDGANEHVVFASPDPIMSPAWSPDGRSLAYVSFHTGLAAIYVQTLATGAQVQVSARSGINGAPSFSPDGSRLALALSRRDGNVDVYVLSLASQELKRITDDPAIDTEPAWAADGQSLYFTSDRAGGPQVYRVAVAEGARPKRITYEGSYNARPRVSPDGRQLAVVTLDRGAYRIGAVDPERGSLQVLSSGQQDESPSFAPNGADILYTSRVGGRDTLAIVSSDGRVQQRIAASAGELREAAWSPFID
jgi:TolB protein